MRSPLLCPLFCSTPLFYQLPIAIDFKRKKKKTLSNTTNNKIKSQITFPHSFPDPQANPEWERGAVFYTHSKACTVRLAGHSFTNQWHMEMCICSEKQHVIYTVQVGAGEN